MTNAMIVLMESVKLMEQGKLKGTGQFIDLETENGIKRLEMPEAIHTYKIWQDLGYQVRKGETSEIKIRIWKYDNRRRRRNSEESEEETQNSERCFKTLASFFTRAQVDPIVKTA